MSVSRPETVRQWLVALAALVPSHGSDNTDAAIRLIAYVQALLDVVPVGAYTPESLQSIARQCQHFPSYAKLCELLEDWWKVHRPDRPKALPAPPTEPPQYRVEIPKRPDPPSEEAKAAVSAIVRALTEEKAAASALLAEDKPRPRPHYLSDRQLLAEYEKLGAAGAVRAEMLRRKIAKQEGEQCRSVEAQVTSRGPVKA